jgi:hypothetical protein
MGRSAHERVYDSVRRRGVRNTLILASERLTDSLKHRLRIGFLRYMALVRGRLESLRYTNADPLKRIYVCPENVTHIQGSVDHPRIETDEWGRVHKYENMGKVVAGRWDAAAEPWEDLAFHAGFKAHFVRGVPWEETEFFQKITADDGDWNKRWDNSRWESHSTEEDVLDALRSYDELFESIRTDGYRESPVLDELAVNIGRNGELIHNNSASHRLSVAKILGVDRIPARVVVRHRDWQRVRANYESAATTQAETSVHPDLRDVR